MHRSVIPCAAALCTLLFAEATLGAEATVGSAEPASVAASPTTADEALAAAAPFSSRDPARAAAILFGWADSIGREHPEARRPDVLYAMALVRRYQGEFEDAVDLLAAALDEQRKLETPHLMEAYILNLGGLVHLGMHRYGRAAELIAGSLQVLGSLESAPPGDRLAIQANLGMACEFAGDFAKAESVLVDAKAKAVSIEGRPGVDTRRTIATYRSRVAERTGRFEECMELGEEVLAELLEFFGEGHRDTIFAREQLGRAYAGLGDLVAAEEQFLAAAAGFEEARSLMGKNKKPAKFKRTPYEYLALTRLELGKEEQAWIDLEKARGRLLAEAIVGDSIPFDRARVQRVLAPDEAIVGWLDYRLVRDHMGRSWAWVLRSEGPVRWARLPRGETETTADLSERIRAFRDEVAAADLGALGAFRLSEQTRNEAMALWNERIAPITTYLEEVNRIVAVPSSASDGLPIELLIAPDGEAVADRWTVSYSPSATVMAWNRERGSSSPVRRALVVGDPRFGPEREPEAGTPPVVVAASRSSSPEVLRGALDGERSAISQLPRLRWSRREAEILLGLLPDSETVLGASATEERLVGLSRADSLVSFDIIHLATHALVDEARPERSALILPPRGTDPLEADGLVTVAEIEDGWRLDAELVTLSACETARGPYIFGEGTAGFVHPLLKAGARGVLASLWAVDDRATALFMEHFYSAWLAGDGSGQRTDPAEALRRAKTDLRRHRSDDGDTPYSHPRYWGAFVLWR